MLWAEMFFINLFLETVSLHEPNKKPFYSSFSFYLCLLVQKTLVYIGCILAQFVAFTAVNVRDMSSRPATYRNNILFLHMVYAILWDNCF